MGKPKKSSIGRGSGGGEKKISSRPTHFLCFPLARKNTVPILSKSMSHFRDVSTEPQRQPSVRPRSRTQQRQEEASSPSSSAIEGGEATSSAGNGNGNENENENDLLGNTSRPTTQDISFEDSLKVLPSIVHRGPGTLHLTLGVMNLSEPAELQRAIDLLRSLDLQQLLREAANGAPAGMKSARKWEDKKQEIDPGQEAAETPAKVEKGAPDTPGTSKLRSLERRVSPPPISKMSGITTSQPPLPPPPLHIALTGISAFTSLKKARVVWARPRAQLPPVQTMPNTAQRPDFDQTEQGRLYNFALHLHYAFRSAHLINETRAPVLHATLANMRYKLQAKGGRTSKGKAWMQGKKRWEEGLVDVTSLGRVFNEFGGDIAAAARTASERMSSDSFEKGDQTDDEDVGSGEEEETRSQEIDDRNCEAGVANKEYVWCQDIKIDRVAICKMGATKAVDPVWVEWYPPVAERTIFELSNAT